MPLLTTCKKEGRYDAVISKAVLDDTIFDNGKSKAVLNTYSTNQ